MTLICGVDEAGRGPLAGRCRRGGDLGKGFSRPPSERFKETDSRKADDLETLIKEQADGWAVAVVSHRRIDEINILQATMEAMRDAVSQLQKTRPMPKP